MNPTYADQLIIQRVNETAAISPQSRWELRWVNPNEIHTHPIHWPKAFAYAKAMEGGACFPAVKAAIAPDGRMNVKNGAHRTHAARLCGKLLLIKVARVRRTVRP